MPQSSLGEKRDGMIKLLVCMNCRMDNGICTIYEITGTVCVIAIYIPRLHEFCYPIGTNDLGAIPLKFMISFLLSIPVWELIHPLKALVKWLPGSG